MPLQFVILVENDSKYTQLKTKKKKHTNTRNKKGAVIPWHPHESSEMDTCKWERNIHLQKFKWVDSNDVSLTHTLSLFVFRSAYLSISPVYTYVFDLYAAFFSVLLSTPLHLFTLTSKTYEWKTFLNRISNLTSLVQISCWSELFLLMKNKRIAYSFSRDVKNWNNFWRNFGRLYLFDWHFFFQRKNDV